MLQNAQMSHQDDLTELAFEHSGDGILITDADHTIVQVNPAFCRLSGFTKETLLHRKPFLLRSGEHDEGFYHRIWRALEHDGFWQGEVCYRHKSGHLFYVWETITAVSKVPGQIDYYVSNLADMSVIKQRQQVLNDLANHDDLTGLPNRHYFNANLTQAIEMCKRRGDKVAILYMDLNKFKPVNDQYGHKAGDILLKEIASRVSESVRREDTFARIGGDEFVILMPTIKERETITGVINRIRNALIKPILVNERVEVVVSASIGVGIYPDDLFLVESNPEKHQYVEIMELADFAMYSAKENGLDHCFFDHAQQLDAEE